MGKIAGVTVKTVYSPTRSLAGVEKEDWPDLIYRKASFAASALNVDLSTALQILDEFEKYEAWKYSPHRNRNDFYKYWLHIEPGDLERIREGYKLLIGRGQTPTHWQQAYDATQPIKKTGAQPGNQNRKKNKRTLKMTPEVRSRKGYLIARLKRDYPDIAERFVNGEFPSARAAARAAGISWKSWEASSSPILQLRYYWRKATEAERLTFLKEIGKA